MKASLIPVDGNPPIEIVRDLTLIGRKEDCDLRLEHKSVSKMHCVLVKTDGLLLLRDLGSTNGTRVNDQRVRRAALLPNDLLAIANYQFKIYLGPDDKPIPVDYPAAVGAPPITPPHTEMKAEGRNDSPNVSTSSLQPNNLPDVYPT
jgi:pSer/pThr/pTyr-binding forkhead associated (FHA) protein